MNNRLRNRIAPSSNHKRIFDYKVKNDSAFEVVLYDEIGLWGVTASDIMEALTAANERPLNVRISSPGGDVFEALAIYNNLANYASVVNTQIDGLAASAASFIAMAGKERTIARNAMVMIHDAIGFTVGNAADHLKQVDLLEGASNTIADIYAQHAGGTKEEWRARMKEETWYYDGQSATAAGLTTGVYDGESNPSDKWDLTLYDFKRVDAKQHTESDFPQIQDVVEEPKEDFTEEELIEALTALKEAFK